jgi:signal transduction histidine kinase
VIQHGDPASPPQWQYEKLAASLAHEISNPVDVLLKLLYLIEPETSFTPQGKKYFSLIRHETNHLRTIVRQAIDEYRRAESSSVTSLPKLIESILHSYGARLTARGIVASTKFCTDGEIRIHPGLLRQCLVSLLLNSVDALPNGGTVHARVALTSERSGLHRRGLRITIADTGCGIPAEKIAQVFEPFFTTKGAAGNGIGLSMARDVVLQHKGVLRVRSSTHPRHSGTVFCIFLPHADVADSD